MTISFNILFVEIGYRRQNPETSSILKNGFIQDKSFK